LVHFWGVLAGQTLNVISWKRKKKWKKSEKKVTKFWQVLVSFEKFGENWGSEFGEIGELVDSWTFKLTELVKLTKVEKNELSTNDFFEKRRWLRIRQWIGNCKMMNVCFRCGWSWVWNVGVWVRRRVIPHFFVILISSVIKWFKKKWGL
jgi:hypothetical protein